LEFDLDTLFDTLGLYEGLHRIGEHFCALQMDHKATDAFAAQVIPLLHRMVKDDDSDVLAVIIGQNSLVSDVFYRYLENLSQVRDDDLEVATLTGQLENFLDELTCKDGPQILTASVDVRTQVSSIGFEDDVHGTLRVTSLEPEDSVPSWIGEKPVGVVEPGDLIFEINGDRGSQEMLRKTLDKLIAKKRNFVMRVVRPANVCLTLHAMLDGPDLLLIECFTMSGDRLATLSMHPWHHRPCHLRVKLRDEGHVKAFKLLLPDGTPLELRSKKASSLAELFGYEGCDDLPTADALAQTVEKQREEIIALRKELAEARSAGETAQIVAQQRAEIAALRKQVDQAELALEAAGRKQSSATCSALQPDAGGSELPAYQLCPRECVPRMNAADRFRAEVKRASCAGVPFHARPSVGSWLSVAKPLKVRKDSHR